MKRALIILTLFPTASVAVAELGDTAYFDEKCIYSIDGITVTTYGVGYGSSASVKPTNSTRLYDSTKAGPWTATYSDGTETDSLMCWTHAAANSIQYWQDVYGVFYKKDVPLPNGYYSTVELPSGSYDKGGNDVSGTVVNDSRNLNIAKNFYDNWTNEGGKFSYASEWYFKGINVAPKSTQFPNKYNGERVNPNSGGYFDSYFKNSASYITIYSQTRHNTTPETSISTNGQYFSSLDDLKNTLISALGFERQTDGSYRQTQEGLMPYIGVWDRNDYGHMLSCQGFTTDTNGNLVSILLANGDDDRTVLKNGVKTVNPASLSERYVKLVDGKIQLYTNAQCTSSWGSYYIGEVSYINTPQVLQNMLAEYSNVSNEAQVWNGHSGVWEQQTASTEALPTESTGWDIHVNGSNIDSEHHGYYHTYATDGRAVLFDDHAVEDKRQITINGTVSASLIEVAAKGYEFKAGENAALAAGADMLIRQAATLHSDLALNLANLTLEAGATLSSKEPIVVTGTFIASLQAATTFSLKNAVTVPARVNADLDLSAAKQIILETSVTLNNHILTLAEGQTITLSSVDENLPFFTDISKLIIGGKQIAKGTDLGDHLVFISPENKEYTNISLIYQNNSIMAASIPEPTTATLSLLALAAIATRRRRAAAKASA